jgi:hypothetical protein
MSKFGFEPDGEPPECIGAVVAWLATNDEAKEFNGGTVFGQQFCAERKLLRGWDGPRPRPAQSRPDLSGARLAALDTNRSG